MSNPRELAAHLSLYEGLGVNGVSTDRAWREREAAPRDGAAGAHAVTAGQVLPDLAGAPGATAVGKVPPASPTAPGTTGVGKVLPDLPVAPGIPGVGEVLPDLPATPRPSDPAEALAAVRADIGDCTRCPLHTLGRKQIVFGVGNPHAELMFVGEAPGADEDEQGEPFVGRAGQLLTKIIEAIDLKRSDVYIANVLKCRPPNNRNPEPVEVETCSPFLLRQIDTIQPKVIVALGTFAAQMLLQTDTAISRLRGRAHAFRGGIKVVPTFHPAYLLRSPDRKRDVWEDMKFVRGLLSGGD